jgi:hypothetical protein
LCCFFEDRLDDVVETLRNKGEGEKRALTSFVVSVGDGAGEVEADDAVDQLVGKGGEHRDEEGEREGERRRGRSGAWIEVAEAV